MTTNVEKRIMVNVPVTTADNLVENQAERDLERFKASIESEGYATGAWRGSVNEVAQPGVLCA